MSWRVFAATILLTGLLCGVVQAQSFTEVGASAGVNGTGDATGIAWGDYDNDGDLDIYAANSGISPNRLYQNNGGTFTEVGAAAGVNYSGLAIGVTWGDYDNDGDLDLFVAVYGAANRLYRNNGNGTFTDVAATAGVDDPSGNSNMGAWADYDRDGYLDLYVINDNVANRLFHNNGNGTFTEVGSTAGVNSTGNSVHIAWGDYDNDGDPDLYVSRTSGNILYKNNNNGTFTDVSASLGVNESTGSPVGVAWQDYDNDGDLDLYAVRNGLAAGAVNRLYRNNGNGTFTEVGASAGVNISSNASMGIAWGDYDNDGDADLYLSMHRSPNLFYKNNGNGTFTEVASAEGVNDSGGARGLSWGDYDNDGDLDLYLTNDNTNNRLFRNNGNSNRWLVVKLVGGTANNKNGIGAQVTAVTGATRQRKDVDGGSGYWSQPSLPVEFGFGSTTTVDSLIVRWPSGLVQTLTNVATNQVLTVTEPGADLQIRGKIVYQSSTNSSSEIWSMNPDGTEKRQLTSNSVYDAEPVWSPDGTRIVFHRDTSGNRDVWVMNEDGSNQINLSNNAAWDSGPAWSPDGSKIVFSSTREDSKSDIYVMSSGGSDLVRLTDSVAGESQARWSPDGTAIAYNRAPAGGNWGLWKMNADGTTPVELDGATSDNPKAWSPDGTKLLYARGNNIYTMNADGTNQQSVVPGVSGIGAWSPEGGKFVYHDGSNLYVKNRDGTAADGFAPVSGFYGASDWQPFRHIGSAGVGSSVSRTMAIDNKGASTLNVTNITSSDGQFTISPTNFSLNVGSSQNVTVTFTPTSTGTKYSTLTISSNDPDTPAAKLAVNGTGIGQFTEVAASAGVNDSGNAVGVAWGDYDSDGDQDLYVSNYLSANLLYKNNGNGTFAEVGASANMNDGGRGRGVAWGDYDNDGDLDLYLVNDNNQGNHLYQNNGNGTFTDVAASAGVSAGASGRSAAWGDYDSDGDLDLYVANAGSANWLYRNNNNGTFTEVGASAGVNDAGNGQGVAWGDYDSDGDLDLYLANSSGQIDRLYRNNSNSTFTEVAAVAGMSDTGDGQGVSWGDYDNDGDLDLYVSNSGQANLLYRNNGNGAFTEVGAGAGVNDGGNGQGVGWGDYDNDGDLDLYLSNYQNANRLYRNNSNGTFTEVGASGGVDANAKSQGAAWGDYDGDGDLDLYLAVDGANRLFKNNGNANRWLVVKLVGTSSNKNGIGARVTAVTGSTRQRRDVDGGSGVWSQPSLPVEFGFGGTSTVDSLIVRWPNGTVQVQTNVATNQLLTATEQAISFSATTITAGTVTKGTTGTSSFTVTNSGGSTLSVSNITSGNSQFTVSPTSFNLSAGASQTVTVTFAPTKVGWEQSVLTISHSASGGSSTVTTSGIGRVNPLSGLLSTTRIAFTALRDGNSEVYKMNFDGSSQMRLTTNSAEDQFPTWSPDGAKLTFTSNRDGNNEIYVMNADGTGSVRLTNNSASDNKSSWSPDGAKIVFNSTRDDSNQEIYTMNADGSGLVRLTNNSAAEGDPAWSPDGAKIVFISRRDVSTYEIYAMNADGSNIVRLTNNSADDLEPSWSPDGIKIVFRSWRDGGAGAETYVMNADGTNQTRLVNDSGNDNYPYWSPDGTKIVFSTNRDGNFELYSMNPDGTNQTRLTSNSTDDFAGSWSTFIANQAPTATAQSVTTVEDTPKQVTLTGTDPNGDPLTFAIAAQPTKGSLGPLSGAIVTYTPTANLNGSDSFTFTASDGQTTSAAATVSIAITSVNDPPTLAAITIPAAILEDAGTQTVNLTGISPGGGETQTLIVTATSSNAALVPKPTVTYTSPNATGSLSYAPVANANGQATITVTVTDDGGTANSGVSTVSQTFTVNVTSVNDKPTITDIAPVSIKINKSTFALPFTIGDVETAAASLTVSGVSSNTTIVPSTNIVFGGSGSNRTVTVTPAANQSGSATIMVKVSDGSADSSDTFVLSVSDIPPPTISDIANQTINEDASTSALSFTVGDAETPVASLTVSGSSSNTALVSTANILFGGSGANRTVTVTPAANQSGTPTITVTVTNGGGLTATDTFILTVNPVNDRPTLAAINNPTEVLEDAGTQAVNLTGISPGGNETQTLTVTATSSNPALLPNPTVTYTSPNATGSLSYAPVANASGQTAITVTVTDDGGTANSGVSTVSQTFTVNVTSVNDKPTLAAIVNPAPILMNAGAQTVNLSGIGSGASNESQVLKVEATSNNTSLIPNPTVTYTSPNAIGSLSYAPVANATGNATVTVTVTDDGGTANGGINTVLQTFTVTVIRPSSASRVYGTAGDRLVMVDALTNSLTGTIAIPAGAGYSGVGTLTLGPDMHTAYSVTGESASGVVAFDVTTNTFGRWYPIPGNRRLTKVGITPDQRNMFVVDQDGLVHVVDLSSGAVAKQIRVPTQNFDGVISKDGTKFYVPHRDAASISVINTASRSVIKTISVPSGANNIAISADGARAYVTHESARVVSCLDLNSDTVIKTVAVQNSPIPIVVSSDGRTVYVGNRDSNSISVIDVASWTVIKTVSNALPGGNVHTLGFANNQLFATGSTVSAVAVYDARVPSALSLLKTISVPIAIGGTELLTAGDSTITNKAPTITALMDSVVVNAGGSTGPLSFTVGDVETPVASLKVSGSSSNTTLVPNANIVFGGSGASRTVVVTPAANQTGKDTITVTVSDGSLSASDSFVVTVRGILGDVNGDGQVDSGDAILVLRHSAGLIVLTDTQKDLGDVNGDRSTDSGDAILILRKSAGLITSFPRTGTAKLVLRPVNTGLRFGEVRRGREGFEVPLILEVGASGADLDLRYDKEHYRLAGVESPSSVLLVSNAEEAGELRLSVARLDAGAPAELLVHLQSPAQALALELRGRAFGGEGEVLSSLESRLDQPVDGFLRGYPNPFNPSTTLYYGLAETGEVRLTIYDISGAVVRRLVSAWQTAGQYSAVWDGRDDEGRIVASGLYLSALQVGSFRQIHKLMLLK